MPRAGVAQTYVYVQLALKPSRRPHEYDVELSSLNPLDHALELFALAVAEARSRAVIVYEVFDDAHAEAVGVSLRGVELLAHREASGARSSRGTRSYVRT